MYVALAGHGHEYLHFGTMVMRVRFLSDFDANNFPAPGSSWRPARLTHTDIPMEVARRPAYGEEPGNLDVTDWITKVNAMPVARVGSAELSDACISYIIFLLSAVYLPCPALISLARGELEARPSRYRITKYVAFNVTLTSASRDDSPEPCFCELLSFAQENSEEE